MQAPLTGKRYRCLICADFDLCEECFQRGHHPQHPFAVRDTPTSFGAPAERPDMMPVITPLATRQAQAAEAVFSATLGGGTVADLRGAAAGGATGGGPSAGEGPQGGEGSESTPAAAAAAAVPSGQRVLTLPPRPPRNASAAVMAAWAAEVRAVHAAAEAAAAAGQWVEIAAAPGANTAPQRRRVRDARRDGVGAWGEDGPPVPTFSLGVQGTVVGAGPQQGGQQRGASSMQAAHEPLGVHGAVVVGAGQEPQGGPQRGGSHTQAAQPQRIRRGLALQPTPHGRAQDAPPDLAVGQLPPRPPGHPPQCPSAAPAGGIDYEVLALLEGRSTSGAASDSALEQPPVRAKAGAGRRRAASGGGSGRDVLGAGDGRGPLAGELAVEGCMVHGGQPPHGGQGPSELWERGGQGGPGALARGPQLPRALQIAMARHERFARALRGTGADGQAGEVHRGSALQRHNSAGRVQPDSWQGMALGGRGLAPISQDEDGAPAYVESGGPPSHLVGPPGRPAAGGGLAGDGVARGARGLQVGQGTPPRRKPPARGLLMRGRTVSGPSPQQGPAALSPAQAALNAAQAAPAFGSSAARPTAQRQQQGQQGQGGPDLAFEAQAYGSGARRALSGALDGAAAARVAAAEPAPPAAAPAAEAVAVPAGSGGGRDLSAVGYGGRDWATEGGHRDWAAEGGGRGWPAAPPSAGSSSSNSGGATAGAGEPREHELLARARPPRLQLPPLSPAYPSQPPHGHHLAHASLSSLPPASPSSSPHRLRPHQSPGGQASTNRGAAAPSAERRPSTAGHVHTVGNELLYMGPPTGVLAMPPPAAPLGRGAAARGEGGGPAAAPVAPAALPRSQSESRAAADLYAAAAAAAAFLGGDLLGGFEPRTQAPRRPPGVSGLGPAAAAAAAAAEAAVAAAAAAAAGKQVGAASASSEPWGAGEGGLWQQLVRGGQDQEAPSPEPLAPQGRRQQQPGVAGMANTDASTDQVLMASVVLRHSMSAPVPADTPGPPAVAQLSTSSLGLDDLAAQQDQPRGSGRVGHSSALMGSAYGKGQVLEEGLGPGARWSQHEAVAAVADGSAEMPSSEGVTMQAGRGHAAPASPGASLLGSPGGGGPGGGLAEGAPPSPTVPASSSRPAPQAQTPQWLAMYQNPVFGLDVSASLGW